MSKDYLDKWEERQKQNTEIIDQQQAKTKIMTQEIFKKEWWDKFDNSLYFDYLLNREEMLNTYRVTYKTYKGSDTSAPVSYAIKYIKAQDKHDAKKAFGLWEGLIIKIERI